MTNRDRRQLAGARLVLGQSRPVRLDDGTLTAFADAVAESFPVTAFRSTDVQAEASPQLVLQSTASRLVVSPVSSDWEAQFYGDFPTDLARCLEYVTGKGRDIVRAWEAVSARPEFVGVVLVARWPDADVQERAGVTALLQNHLHSGLPGEAIQELGVRVGLRIEAEHFATFTLKTYETRMFEGPVFPGGISLASMNPLRGRLTESGVEVTVDVNNRPATASGATTSVDEAGLEAMVALSRGALEIATGYFSSGALPSSPITKSDLMAAGKESDGN